MRISSPIHTIRFLSLMTVLVTLCAPHSLLGQTEELPFQPSPQTLPDTPEDSSPFTDTAVATDLSVSPASLDFGQVMAGNTVSRVVSLTHTGRTHDNPITVLNTAIDELDSLFFTDNFEESRTLYVGETTEIVVYFTAPEGPNNSRTDGHLFVSSEGTKTGNVIRMTGATLSSEPMVQPQGLRATTKVGFGKSTVDGISSDNPTSLQFGPDGRLYVSDLFGKINIYTLTRSGANDYSVIATETLNHINAMVNHDDDGEVNKGIKGRLVTGLLVTGTANKPVIYVNSSDPRIGAGKSQTDTGLDTNSGILSRLNWTGSSWVKTDLVRGLPRSEENHIPNGLTLSADGKTLYIAAGGHTNAGATSANFAKLPEFALSAAILSVDLVAIGNSTYDLPTLDDEDRKGGNDKNDPFGGNQGKNQAILTNGGPVQVYAPGFRNPYDVVLTTQGKLYSIDNGPNAGWGDVPEKEGMTGNCTNAIQEPGDSHPDSLHYITGKGYYGGHPNPTRGNKKNTFNKSNPQSPVSKGNAIECDYRAPGSANKALLTFNTSTNGLTEYTASNFSGAIQGNLLATGWNNKLFSMALNDKGDSVVQSSTLFSNIGSRPLDVTTLSDQGIYPGTIWVADFAKNAVIVFEPADFNGQASQSCTGISANLDEDNDGFSNADETANGTDPCSAGDSPADYDGDSVSDLLDPDDDNDGLDDIDDPFALDSFNGRKTQIPQFYDWENDSQPAGGIANLGFTGLMTNGIDSWDTLFNPDAMTVSGAAGVLTIDAISGGDAFKGNGQENAFQFGVDATPNTAPFTAHTKIIAPFSGFSPKLFQSLGIFVGTGTQDDYVKLVINASGSTGGFQLFQETNNAKASDQNVTDQVFGADSIDVYLSVDPKNLQITGSYRINHDSHSGLINSFAEPVKFPNSWLTASTGLAIGIISTSFKADTFAGTWDYIAVSTGIVTADVVDNTTDSETGSDNTGADNPVTNQPPTVDAGDAITLRVPAQISLSGSVSDDGLPTGQLDTLWTLQSGPGNIQIDDITQLNTAVTFSSAGRYVLELIADDSDLITSDTRIVDVLPAVEDDTINDATDDNTTDPDSNPGSESGSDTGADTGSNSDDTASEDASNIPMDDPATTENSDNNSETVYRINAGGPALVSNGITWDTDLQYINTGRSSNNDSSVDMSQLTGDIPVQIFAHERFDPIRSPALEYTFPVSPGRYEVRLYFVETSTFVSGPNERIFDVIVEGTSIPTIDMYQEAGYENAFMRKVVVDADSLLSINFEGIKRKPAINGIEIIRVSNVEPDDSVNTSGPVDNTDTEETTDTADESVPTETTETSFDSADNSPDSGSENSQETGPDSGQESTDSTNQATIRINAGGPTLNASQVWYAKNDGVYSVNTGRTYSTMADIDISALPFDVPQSLFQTERWDKSSSPSLKYAVPVEPGQYSVRLYFAEIYPGAFKTGHRVFDVKVENELLQSIDVFGEVGSLTAMVREVVVQADNVLTIEFIHVTENPAIKGIEIIPLSN